MPVSSAALKLSQLCRILTLLPVTTLICKVFTCAVNHVTPRENSTLSEKVRHLERMRPRFTTPFSSHMHTLPPGFLLLFFTRRNEVVRRGIHRRCLYLSTFYYCAFLHEHIRTLATRCVIYL